METFDTNVLVRLLVEDDQQPSAAALRRWRQATETRDRPRIPLVGKGN
jgi:predicted nucleic acid-binding protein